MEAWQWAPGSVSAMDPRLFRLWTPTGNSETLPVGLPMVLVDLGTSHPALQLGRYRTAPLVEKQSGALSQDKPKGKRLDQYTCTMSLTRYMAPTILLNPSSESRVMKEEIFGPILPVVEVDCMDDAIDFVKSGARPLVVYMFTTNKELQQKALMTVQTGALVFNETILQFILNGLPFGGVGESGTGSYHWKYSFDVFSHPKAVLSRGFLFDIPIRYPPFTEFKKRIFTQLLAQNYIGVLLAALGLKRDGKRHTVGVKKE